MRSAMSSASQLLRFSDASMINCYLICQLAIYLFICSSLICTVKSYLSHEVASGSDIMPCSKIDKPIFGKRNDVDYNVRKIRENLDVFTPKMQFLSIFTVV